nr:hypothetical protein [Tanacetum cinerariifolium]
FTHEEWDAPYWHTFGILTKEFFKDPAIYKTVVDQIPTPREMVQVESLSDDQLNVKMSVLHCLMVSHGGKLLACYRGLNQSHHEYVSSTDSRLKGYEEMGRLAEASPLVAQTDYAFLNKIFEYAAEPLSVILQLEPKKFVCLANIPTSRDAHVSPPIVMESTGTSHVLDDVVEVTVVESKRVSFGLTNVIVAISAGEKGDGSLLSYAADEE